jgi:Putative zinc-finger
MELFSHEMRVSKWVSDMSCNRLAICLDAFLDGDIQQDERAALEAHIRECAECESLLAREHRLQQTLKARPVPEPTTDVLEQMLSTAVHRGTRQQRSRWWSAAVGGALAAGLAAWMLLGPLQQRPIASPPSAPVASVTMTLQETRTIRLVFASPADMGDARLSLSLPSGVELVGHEGQREIRWKTQLQRGKNVLPLKLVAHEGSGGELIAQLKHGEHQKTFRVRVLVRPNQHDNASIVSTYGSTTV